MLSKFPPTFCNILQHMRCCTRQKFDANRSIIKLSKNRQVVGLKRLSVQLLSATELYRAQENFF